MSAYKSQMSQFSAASKPPVGGTTSAARIGCAGTQDRQIYPPSIPSNLQRDADQEVVFNSIGFYSDLLSRLDGQIKSTEDVFVSSQMKVSDAQENPQNYI